MSENEVQNKYGASANEMSLKQKFAMYRECFSLPSEEDRGAYCRQHQIYMADLESWGQEIEESVSADSQSLTLENNQMKAECQQLKQQLHKAESENKDLSQKIKDFSQKMIHWEVHKEQKSEIAATFLENALKKEKLAISGHLNGKVSADISIADKLILHSDNGGPMKGSIESI